MSDSTSTSVSDDAAASLLLSPSQSNGMDGTRRVSTVLSATQQAVLERSLANRPSASSLAAVGITVDGGRFVSEKLRLAHSLAGNILRRELDDRPLVSELLALGILEQTSVAPALAGKAKSLKKALLADSLNAKLYVRDHVDTGSDTLFRASGVAPRLRGASIALERAITRDRLGALMESRPDVAALVASNIFPQTPISMASSLSGLARKLERQYTADMVSHQLEARSDASELAAQGVLNIKVAPALQGVQKRLEHNLAKSNLYHALQSRPTVHQLAARRIWQPQVSIPGGDDEDDGAMASAYDADDVEYDAPRGQAMSPSSAANRAANDSYASNPLQSPNTTASYASIAAAEAAYKYYQEQAQIAVVQDAAQQQYYASASPASSDSASSASAFPSTSASSSARRSKTFHLTRILLRFASSMGSTGELTPAEKSFLKELIVDQVTEVYWAAENFDGDNDLYKFKGALQNFAKRR